MVLPLRHEVQDYRRIAYFLHYEQQFFALLYLCRLRAEQELHRRQTLREPQQALAALQWQVLPDEKTETGRRQAKRE